MQDNPIFIGGLQRSGTSLLRGIIGSHPDVAIFQWDLPLWTDFYERYRHVNLNIEANYQQLVDEIFSNEKMKNSDISLSVEDVYQSLKMESYITCGIVFSHILKRFAQKINRSRWGLKTPHNEFYAEAIFEEFPEAKIIQIIRDPRDVAVSYQSYDNGAWHYNILNHIYTWKKSANLAYLHQQKYGKSYQIVRYEDLVVTPETTIHELCENVDLDYSSDMLRMQGQMGWNGSNSFFGDVGSGISQSAIGRFKEKLTSRQIWLYQYFLKKEMHDWKYELEPVSLSSCDRISVFGQLLVSAIDFSIIHLLKPYIIQLKGKPIYNSMKRIYTSFTRRVTWS